jgi:transposase InsO family protein
VPDRDFHSIWGFLEILEVERDDRRGVKLHAETQAFPWNEAPRYLVRDRDATYGTAVTRRLRAIGIRDKPIAPGSPWQNCYAERTDWLDSRECADHVIALSERHLRQVLQSYARYYNTARTHRSLNKDAPIYRPVQRIGRVVSPAVLGGLHHRYARI